MRKNKIEELLYNGISKARNELDNKSHDVFEKARQEYFKTTELGALIEEKESIEDEKQKLTNRLRDIESDIGTKDRRLSNNEKKEMGVSEYNNSKTISDYMAWKKVKDTKEYKNSEAFSFVAEKFIQMYGVAITPNERRDVLNKFYMFDWVSLGIEIPIDVLTDEISIKDGVINITRKQLEGPKD